MRSTALWGLVALLVFLPPIAAKAGEHEHDEDTRAAMGEIFAAIQIVMLQSLSDERFSDPAERETIQRALDQLAAGGAMLETHARGQDEGFSFLSRSLAHDVVDIRDRFAAGKTNEARFLLHEVTRTCVSCHSRLPDPPTSTLASRFVSENEFAALPLEEQARLQVATRQFDSAIRTYEAMLKSTALSAEQLDRDGHLDDYLELSIRVRGDFSGPARSLAGFLKRNDLSSTLRAEVTTWLAALRSVPEVEPGAQPLPRAKALLKIADDTARYPNDRTVLVHYFAASSLLNQYVAERPPKGAEVAEAYYLLGLIESRVGQSIWISQTEPYLEAAIRAAPKDPIAKQAYALLEEFLISGYTGSAGTNIPPDEMKRLRELRALMDEA